MLLVGCTDAPHKKFFWENALSSSISFSHRHKDFEIALSDEGVLELYLDGCLRKKRERGTKEPQYVWTNVELEWEEHHYIEARYWASVDDLQITVNGAPLLKGSFKN